MPLFTIPTTFVNAHARCYTREAPLIQSATQVGSPLLDSSMLWLFREAITSPIIVFTSIPTCYAGTNSIAIDLITVKDRFFFLSASATSPGPPATIRPPFLLVVIRWLRNDFSIPRAPENMSHENIHYRKWQDYVYIQCEYKSTKQKIKHLLREENKVKENKIS